MDLIIFVSLQKKINCKNIIFTSSISTYGSGNHEKDEDTETKPTTTMENQN